MCNHKDIDNNIIHTTPLPSEGEGKEPCYARRGGGATTTPRPRYRYRNTVWKRCEPCQRPQWSVCPY